MIIDVDGKTIVVPAHIEARIIEQVYLLVEELYLEQLPKPIRIAAKHFSRQKIAELETRINAQGGNGKLIRPPDGEDPNLHYLKILLANSQKVLTDAILLIDTDPSTNAATAFNLSVPNQDQFGGSHTFGGYFGEREDYGGEIAGPVPDTALSNL